MTTSLTDRQLRELETTERIASCFSLAATSFVFFTFVYSPAFRKPVNRLLFFATWGNMACNVRGMTEAAKNCRKLTSQSGGYTIVTDRNQSWC